MRQPDRTDLENHVSLPQIHVTNDNPLNYTDRLYQMWDQLSESTYVKKIKVVRRRAAIPRDAVTVVVHASVTKLQRLLFLIDRWGGPVSASVYFKKESEIATFANFYMEHAYTFRFAEFHIMMEVTKYEYPHNILREMALTASDSDYFLALDVDFVTTPNASTGLHTLIRTDEILRKRLQDRTLMVLPAFNRNLRVKVNETNVFEVGNRKLPRDKNAVSKMWDEDRAEPFHMKTFRYGHGPTHFHKWCDYNVTNSSFYMTKYKHGFEPYVLGYKRDIELPHYWAGFRGFGYNKYTWFVEAHCMGFRYGVLRDYFVVHLDHHYDGRKISRRTIIQMEYFKDHLQEKYNLTDEELETIVGK